MYSWFQCCASFCCIAKLVTHTHSFFNIILHHGPSQENAHSSLCCRVRPYCVSIQNVIVCIYQLQTPCPSPSSSTPSNHESILYVWVCFFFLIFIYSFIYLFIYWLFRATATAYGGSQARGQVGAVAAGLHHSHSHTGSKLCLPSTPQLTATPDP